MAKTLKMTFATDDDKNRVIGIADPKENISREDCEAAMTAIAESGAFDGITEPIKAVLLDSTSEIIYEA